MASKAFILFIQYQQTTQKYLLIRVFINVASIFSVQKIEYDLWLSNRESCVVQLAIYSGPGIIAPQIASVAILKANERRRVDITRYKQLILINRRDIVVPLAIFV